MATPVDLLLYTIFINVLMSHPCDVEVMDIKQIIMMITMHEHVEKLIYRHILQFLIIILNSKMNELVI